MEIFVRRYPVEKIKEKRINEWPIWTSPESEFDWFYESPETCWFIEGEALVKTSSGGTKIEAGDLVVFPKGLKCVWKVIKPVKKYYKFEDFSSNL